MPDTCSRCDCMPCYWQLMWVPWHDYLIYVWSCIPSQRHVVDVIVCYVTNIADVISHVIPCDFLLKNNIYFRSLPIHWWELVKSNTVIAKTPIIWYHILIRTKSRTDFSIDSKCMLIGNLAYGAHRLNSIWILLWRNWTRGVWILNMNIPLWCTYCC